VHRLVERRRCTARRQARSRARVARAALEDVERALAALELSVPVRRVIGSRCGAQRRPAADRRSSCSTLAARHEQLEAVRSARVRQARRAGAASRRRRPHRIHHPGRRGEGRRLHGLARPRYTAEPSRGGRLCCELCRAACRRCVQVSPRDRCRTSRPWAARESFQPPSACDCSELRRRKKAGPGRVNGQCEALDECARALEQPDYGQRTRKQVCHL